VPRPIALWTLLLLPIHFIHFFFLITRSPGAVPVCGSAIDNTKLLVGETVLKNVLYLHIFGFVCSILPKNKECKKFYTTFLR